MRLLPNSSVGKKILMALSGLAMVLFILLHLLGNTTIFSGSINAYAQFLHSFPVAMWIYRSVLVILFLLHGIVGIQLYLENRGAKPARYAVEKSLRTTFAGRTMIWTGLLIGAFVIYHLLHFTIQVTNPEVSSLLNPDAAGRPDIFRMVVMSFQNNIISLTYVFAMVALLLHLIHGIQSAFQSLGLNNDRTLPVMIRAGYLAAVIMSLGYMSIPVAILLNVTKG